MFLQDHQGMHEFVARIQSYCCELSRDGWEDECTWFAEKDYIYFLHCWEHKKGTGVEIRLDPWLVGRCKTYRRKRCGSFVSVHVNCYWFSRLSYIGDVGCSVGNHVEHRNLVAGATGLVDVAGVDGSWWKSACETVSSSRRSIWPVFPLGAQLRGVRLYERTMMATTKRKKANRYHPTFVPSFLANYL